MEYKLDPIERAKRKIDLEDGTYLDQIRSQFQTRANQGWIYCGEVKTEVGVFLVFRRGVR